MLFHSATDVRHGVEEKFWLAQTEQANLYSDRAQEALETVKVVCAIHPSCEVLISSLFSHQRFVDEAIEIRGRKDGLLVPVPQ